MPHLWEVKHDYYCSEGCHFSNDCHVEYGSWRSFLEEWGAADKDYNLLFRWDWRGPGWTEEEHEELHLFYMLQRKARPQSVHVTVRREDEPQIRAFLEKKWRELQGLWAPFHADSAADTEAMAAEWRKSRVAQLRAELEALEAK